MDLGDLFLEIVMKLLAGLLRLSGSGVAGWMAPPF